MSSSPQKETVSLLKSKRYALFWISSLLSNIGTWMQQVAQPWVLLSLSPSSFWIGLDSFAMNAPGWIFTLWGGVIADRFDRKKIVVACQSIQFFCVLALLFLIVTGEIRIWMILLGSVVIGTTDALSMPAFQSIIPSLVTGEELPRAIALNSTQFNLSRVLGPSIAGFAITLWGVSASYGANLVSFIPFFLSLYWIYPRNTSQFQRPKDSTPAQLSDYKALMTNKNVFVPLLTIFISTLFCSPLLTFAPVLVKEVYNGSAVELGQAMAAFGGGGVVGAIFSAMAKPKVTSSQWTAHIVAIFFGFTLTMMTWMNSIYGVEAVLVGAGIAMAITGTTVNSILQKTSANHYRGRFVSLFQLALHGGIALGSLLLGISSSKLGIVNALWINGLTAIILQVTMMVLSDRHK